MLRQNKASDTVAAPAADAVASPPLAKPVCVVPFTSEMQKRLAAAKQAQHAIRGAALCLTNAAAEQQQHMRLERLTNAAAEQQQQQQQQHMRLEAKWVSSCNSASALVCCGLMPFFHSLSRSAF